MSKTTKEKGKELWRAKTPAERKAILNKLLTTKQISPIDYVVLEPKINEPLILEKPEETPKVVVIKQPEPHQISDKISEKPEKTDAMHACIGLEP